MLEGAIPKSGLPMLDTAAPSLILHPQNLGFEMARHKQPREHAELKGADKKNPQRYVGEVIKSDMPLGEAYPEMTEDAKAVWFELSTTIPAGILTATDKRVFKVLCNLIAEYDRAPEDFAVGKYTHLIGLCARFGMTPADRQKFTTDKGKQENPFENLLN